MIEVPVYNKDGKQTDALQLDEALLGGEVRPNLLKQAFVAGHANRRQGTATTRNRSAVEGSTRKLYRQKGTGRARRGAIRTNILRGGGVAFAKQPKSWRQAMPNKMRRLANRNAVLSKAVDGELKVIDAFDLSAPSTKQFAGILEALNIDRTCLLAVEHDDQNTRLSARNIPHVSLLQINQLNVYDLMNHRYLLVARSTFEGWVESLKQNVGATAGSEKEAA
jgi:large subunit ribosomal protein L4